MAQTSRMESAEFENNCKSKYITMNNNRELFGELFFSNNSLFFTSPQTSVS